MKGRTQIEIILSFQKFFSHVITFNDVNWNYNCWRLQVERVKALNLYKEHR